jgi:hypothetical protein
MRYTKPARRATGFTLSVIGSQVYRWKMKAAPACLTLLAILVTQAASQRDVPPQPGAKFKPRAIDGGGQGGIEVVPKTPPKVRYTTHIVLSESRTWTSADGKPLEAKLLAFEDLVAEADQGAAAPAPPEPPKHPTVVRGDKVRLLANRKPVEVPLSRLSQEDRDFVERIRRAKEKTE